MSRIKVAHVINSLAAGGAEKLLADLLPRLARHGIDSEVLALDPKGAVFAETLNHADVPVRYAAGPVYSPARIGDIKRYLRRFNPTIVHSHLAPSFHWTALSEPRAGRPLITTEHATANRRMGNPLLNGFERWAYSRYDSIVCVSSSVSEALKAWLGLDSEKLPVIPNGIPIEKFSNKARPAPDVAAWLNGRRGIAMVARFVPAKDHGTAIRMLEFLPLNYALVFAGDGPERHAAEQAARERGFLSRCLFAGTRDDIPEVLAACALYIQPSRNEGFGIAAVEAMAAGLPVAASDLDGLRDIVSGAGWTFKPGDAEAAAASLLELDSPGVRERAILAGRNKARGYSIDATAAGYAELYERTARRT